MRYSSDVTGTAFYVRGDKRTTVIDLSHSLWMTPYRLPHHRYRSFAAAQDDALPSAVILNGVKKALRERWETG